MRLILLALLLAGCVREPPMAAVHVPFSNCGPSPAADTITRHGAVVVYGDSIAVAARPMMMGWEADAQECRSLYADQEAGARLIAAKPQVVWLAIGTNDYYLSRWTPDAFGRAYAGLLDGLHAGLPNARIVAQSPLIRTDSVRNSIGFTLADYRRQIENACSTRSWAFCVNGLDLMPASGLGPDGVHPTAEGLEIYAASIARLSPHAEP